MIGQPDNYWDEFDERSTIGHLMPLNVQRRKLLLHPVIDTFVMIKYNSYAVFFITTILMRLFFSLLMTGLTVNYPINVTATMSEMNETINMNEMDEMNATMNETMNANNTFANNTFVHNDTVIPPPNDSNNFER